ncbi:MAG TPA: GntR family transcriptional regulator [Solirubrobacterales bacterium]|nr:GntR family transcriptional regulator [Solirubrobacterales bacterium]
MAIPTDKLSRPFERLVLDRQSTPSQITDALEDEILDGALKPGERLREAKLAEAFSVSRNSVREALRVLERKGLVRHVPHRGAEVIKLTEGDVDDLFRVRAVLERQGLASVDGAEARTLLIEEVEGIEAAAREGDTAALLEHDLAFHRILVQQIGSRRFNELYVTLQRELRLALLQLDSFDPTMAQVEEHREIVEAVQAGQVEKADKLLTRHLDVAAGRVGDLVAEQG